MPTLVTDVGSATANSYASLAEYKSYLETRLPAPTWLAAAIAGTIDEQLKVDLIAAARSLDVNIPWTGSAVDSVQIRSWPRKGMFDRNGNAIAENVNPFDLKQAQSEYAIQLRNSDLLSDNEAEKKGVRKVKAGSVEVEFQSVDSSSSESVDIQINRLSPEFGWVRVPQAVRDLLVESWYARGSVSVRYKGRLDFF